MACSERHCYFFFFFFSCVYMRIHTINVALYNTGRIKSDTNNTHTFIVLRIEFDLSVLCIYTCCCCVFRFIQFDFVITTCWDRDISYLDVKKVEDLLIFPWRTNVSCVSLHSFFLIFLNDMAKEKFNYSITENRRRLYILSSHLQPSSSSIYI